MRGQASLPPARRLALTIPAPEQLGIPLPRPVASDPIDWAAVHAQLDRLEVRCFHLEKRAGGGCRVTCLLPGTAQGAAHRIEALAASEPEAIRLTLAQAEAWSNSR